MTSFTQEELARLVQFITGSSQLPPGGFAELSPPIQISSAPTTDALPTAHTWWVKYRILSRLPPVAVFVLTFTQGLLFGRFRLLPSTQKYELFWRFWGISVLSCKCPKRLSGVLL